MKLVEECNEIVSAIVWSDAKLTQPQQLLQPTHPDPTFHTPTLDSASETISDPFDEKGCSKLRRCRFRRVAVPLTQVWRHPCLLCNGGLLTFWIQYLLFPPPRYILPPKPLTSHSIRHTMIVYKQ